MYPTPPEPTIEDEFLPKAPNWNSCYCVVCNFYLNNSFWVKFRQKHEQAKMYQHRNQPVSHRPTKICRKLRLDWHSRKNGMEMGSYNWENETSDYNPDSFKEPPLKKKKG